MLGGSLNNNDTFKKILSIGYEFETHDYAKFSLHTNGRTLINSDLVLRNIPDKIEDNTVKIVDDNYLLVRIPIHEKEEEKEEKKEEKKEEEEEEKKKEEEDEMAEFQRIYMEEFGELEEKEATEKHLNESYLEYFNENRKKDNKKIIKFQVTNDIGDGFFAEMLANNCKKIRLPKNKMYFFRTNAGKVFDLKFAENIVEDCETFSGVEYVVTYYKPTQQNPNIILETFIDACSRILDHLGDLEKTMGTLLISDAEAVYTTIGKLEKSRKIYHKPNTNLFYLDTYDDEDWVKTRAPRNIKDAIFIPQMTFRCKSSDAIDIMKDILNKDPQYKIGKTTIKEQIKEYEDIIKVEKMVDDLIAHHNTTSESPILLSTDIGKTLKCYIFLIFYKIYNYVQNHKDLLSKKYYLKDFLTYSSRHSNYDLYIRVKQILKKHYRLRTSKKVLEFFYQPTFFKPLYDFPNYDEDEFDEKGNYIYGDGLKDNLKKTNKNYGNPLYSLSSYFEFFEKPLESEFVDEWFIYSKTDVFSTTFDLKNDVILLENRYFKDEIGLWLRNNVNPNIHSNQLNIREMYQLVSALYGKDVGKLMNLEMDVRELKLTKKRKPVLKHRKNLKSDKNNRKTVKKTKHN